MGPWIKGTYIIQVFLWWWLQWRIELNFFEHSLLRYETEFFLPGEVWLSCQNGNQSVWVRYRSTRIKLILEWAYSLYNLIHNRLTSQNLLSFMSENHGSICSVCMNTRVVMAHDFHQWVLAILLWCWNCSCSELYKGLLMDLKKRGAVPEWTQQLYSSKNNQNQCWAQYPERTRGTTVFLARSCGRRSQTFKIALIT